MIKSVRTLSFLIALIVPYSASALDGYLSSTEMPAITTWLPPMPSPGSPAEARDQGTYFLTRGLISGPRGAEAVADNVYLPSDVAPRFADALGLTLTEINANVILTVIGRAQKDSEKLLAPIKKPVLQGGRVRPYVANPSEPACPHEQDDAVYHLKESGAYPSGHATIGMLWGLILSELAPDKTDAVMTKGFSFGESRGVCGFHWASDIDAGRLAASVLVARLHSSKDFLEDMKAAKAQLNSARKIGPALAATQLNAFTKREGARPKLELAAP